MGDVVSRRNFVALAAGGASAAMTLSACSQGTASPASKKTVDEMRGGGDPWGEHPDKKGKNHFPQNGNDKVEFKPKFLCLVYLKFDAATIIAKHAYFPFRTNDASFAKATLSEFATKGWPANAIRPSDDFDRFIFGSQQRIYFFVDNGEEVVFDEKFLIAFTPFGEDTGRPRWDNTKFPPALSDPKPKDKNNAFFDAKIIEPNLLALDNWFTTKNGKLFDKNESETYSMNIHLKMKSSAGKFIPIIIDPNTGNGAGNEP